MAAVEQHLGITGATALAIVTRVSEAADAIGKTVFVAVVDGAGRPIALLGHEKVPPICRQISEDKAWTAYASRQKTSAWKRFVLSAPEEERHLMLAQPRYVAAAGGCPILIGGMLAGAVGVSGAGQQEDEDLADIGAALAVSLAE